MWARQAGTILNAAANDEYRPFGSGALPLLYLKQTKLCRIYDKVSSTDSPRNPAMGFSR